METYGEITFMLGFVGFFISILSGIIYALCKRTLKYTWIFGCIAGSCFFIAIHHIIILIGYDDITDPTYEAYKDWSIYDLILCDMIHLFIWLGIGILNYMVFIKRNKLLTRLLILGTGVLLLSIVLLAVSSSVVSM